MNADRKILLSILKDYLWNIPATRILLMPTLTSMLISKYLEVKVADLYRDISKVIQSNENPFSTIVYFALILLTSVILVEMQFYIICRAGQIGNRLANKNTYQFFLNLRPELFNKIGKGEIQNTVTRKSQAVQDIIDVFTLNFFPTFITVLLVSYKVISNIGLFPVIIINICIFIYAFSTIKITIWRNELRKNIISTSNNSANIMIDGLLNYENVYINNNQEFETRKYDNKLKVLETHNTKLSQSLYLLNLVQREIWCMQSIIIITVSVYGLFLRKMNTEEFAFYITIIAILVKNLDNLGFMYGKYKQAMINMQYFPNVLENQNTKGYRTVYGFFDQIEFKNICFSHNEKQILENINLKIQKGDKVAIIGNNGAGKSTFMKCLLKFLAYEGKIQIDGIDITEILDSHFYNLISYIPQNAVLFNESVMFNIKYGNSKVDEEDIYLLSKELAMHDSLLHLKDGYFTNVGEQGKAISGGERQKVVILRALLQKPSILIMDESTANLDKLSEKTIIEKLTAMKDMTIITIIHKLELLPLFNRVITLGNKGAIELIK